MLGLLVGEAFFPVQDDQEVALLPFEVDPGSALMCDTADQRLILVPGAVEQNELRLEALGLELQIGRAVANQGIVAHFDLHHQARIVHSQQGFGKLDLLVAFDKSGLYLALL